MEPSGGSSKAFKMIPRFLRGFFRNLHQSTRDFEGVLRDSRKLPIVPKICSKSFKRLHEN